LRVLDDDADHFQQLVFNLKAMPLGIPQEGIDALCRE
jgi:hypothetical protein